MVNIIEQAFSEAKKVPGVETPALENVIRIINKKYAAAKRQERTTIDFIEMRDQALEYNDLFDLFTHQAYKSAVGIYYSHVKRLAAQFKPHVTEVCAKSVTVRTTRKVSITFSTLIEGRQLKFSDLDTGRNRIVHLGKSDRVPESAYVAAKRMALAALNSRRK